MDIEQARTFLAVVATGNFVSAGARLHVTQSTVSARIQVLERELGAKLFQRGRGGAELTAAGRRFLRHAKALVRTLEQARHEIGLPSGFQGSLRVSGRIALWEGLLTRWVGWMRARAEDISLRLEIGFEEDIMQALVQGNIDIGLMYTPQSRPGLAVERLFDESLVLVGTDPARPWPDARYVHVDWGPEFHDQFAARWPGLGISALTANIGWLALRLILDGGGSAYLPQRMVREHLRVGALGRIDQGPAIPLPAYLAYPRERAETDLSLALAGLRELAGEEIRAAP